jgi:hypothetical protein
MTPYDIHYGLAAAKWQHRAAVLRAAYDAHPERFPHGVPVPPPLPTAAWINSPRPRWPSPRQRGPDHDGDSEISEADCLIRLDNFRASKLPSDDR